MNAPDRHTPIPNGLGEHMRELAADEAAGLAEVWRLSGKPAEGFPDPARLDAIWRHLETVTGAPAPAAPGRRDRRPAARRATSRWFAGVTAVAALCAIGLFIWSRPLSVTAPLGDRLAVTLADGSTVELNSGATLRYPRRFGSTRTIALEGEAFFDVAHDGRPFVVETHDAFLTVLGTTFNVRSWPNDMNPATSVTLQTGRVMLTPRDAEQGEPAYLEPGQTAVVEDARIAVGAVDPENADRVLSWRQGDFIYSDRPLGSILTDIERRYAIELSVTPASRRATRLSVSIRQPGSAEALIRDLCGGLGLQYRETRRGFELFDPGT
ncbi:MAG: FecR domain-containing protein [Rhodothermales bacterium]